MPEQTYIFSAEFFIIPHDILVTRYRAELWTSDRVMLAKSVPLSIDILQTASQKRYVTLVFPSPVMVEAGLYSMVLRPLEASSGSYLRCPGSFLGVTAVEGSSVAFYVNLACPSPTSTTAVVTTSMPVCDAEMTHKTHTNR